MKRQAVVDENVAGDSKHFSEVGKWDTLEGYRQG